MGNFNAEAKFLMSNVYVLTKTFLVKSLEDSQVFIDQETLFVLHGGYLLWQ